MKINVKFIITIIVLMVAFSCRTERKTAVYLEIYKRIEALEQDFISPLSAVLERDMLKESFFKPKDNYSLIIDTVNDIMREYARSISDSTPKPLNITTEYRQWFEKMRQPLTKKLFLKFDLDKIDILKTAMDSIKINDGRIASLTAYYFLDLARYKILRIIAGNQTGPMCGFCVGGLEESITEDSVLQIHFNCDKTFLKDTYLHFSEFKHNEKTKSIIHYSKTAYDNIMPEDHFVYQCNADDAIAFLNLKDFTEKGNYILTTRLQEKIPDGSVRYYPARIPFSIK